MKITQKEKEYKHAYYIKNIEIKKAWQKNYGLAHKVERSIYNKEYRKTHSYKDYYKTSSEKYRQKIKLIALQYYGGNPPKCSCCGEYRIEFLAIDHIDGGGSKHRKERKGQSIYQWLKINNYPNGYRVLCHNCNMSLGFYKYCPHNKL